MSAEPIEVIILNDYASLTGGSSAVAFASALGLAARDIPVTLFTCVGPVALQLRAFPNLKVICLDQLEIGKNPNHMEAFVDGWRNARAVRALREVLASKSPARTLVHAHTWSQSLSPFALEVVATMGFQLVVTLHDFFITCPTGTFFVHPKAEICRRVPLSLSCWRCNCDRRNYGHKLWRNVRTVIQNRMLKLPDKVSYYIGVSAFSLNIMRPYLPAAAPAKVVRNPVDCVKEKPVPVAQNHEFLFIGRFSPEKGVALFAQAVRATGVPATFIGDGALMPAVRQICPDSRFTGWLNQAEIRRHLRNARALVFPPLWYETLGLVVIEAAAAGVPVIISDQCAATDYIYNNINGLYFANGSAESLKHQIAAVAEDHDLASRLGQAAYELYWRDPWTSDRHVSELLEIYNELVWANASTTKGGTFHESIGCNRAGS
jgi:glycosyltransferase involved in cell wall biosynthesis